MFLKHRGFVDLLITQGPSFSVPLALHVKVGVIQSLAFFPPRLAFVASGRSVRCRLPKECSLIHMQDVTRLIDMWRQEIDRWYFVHLFDRSIESFERTAFRR